MLRRNRAVLGIGLTALVALVAYLALPHHPAYQEWRCRGRSLAELEAVHRGLPESPIVLYYLGTALHQAGRSAEAVPPLQRAALLDQHSVRIRESLVQAQLATGQTRPTFELLRQFLNSHPDEPEAYHMMGRFLLGVQTYSRAVVVLEQAAVRFPNNPTSWTLLASAREQFRDLSGARKAIDRAVALPPVGADTYLLQARILSYQGLVDEARAAYIRAVERAPEDIEIKAECADFIARQGGSERDQLFARGIARRVLQQAPGHARASGALGLLLADRNEVAEAVPLLETAVSEKPGDVRVLRTLQRVARQRGDKVALARWTQAFARAQSYLDEEQRLLDALGPRPKDPDLLERMAHLTGRNGDLLKSLRYHAIRLGVTPDTASAQLATARDLRDGGFEDAARQLAERVLATSSAPGEQAAARSFLTAPRP